MCTSSINIDIVNWLFANCHRQRTLNSRQAMTCWFHRLLYHSIALDPKGWWTVTAIRTIRGLDIDSGELIGYLNGHLSGRIDYWVWHWNDVESSLINVLMKSGSLLPHPIDRWASVFACFCALKYLFWCSIFQKYKIDIFLIFL